MIKNKEEYLNIVNKLNEYTYYYDLGIPKISDKDWDSLYYEVVEFENKTGFIAENSPTNNIIYEVKSSLKKVKHSHKMLSLSKTKDIDDVKQFISNNDAIVMAKMDGLTCSLTYDNGKLILAETRGNGEIGEDITHNAKVIKSIPKELDYTGHLVVDGEIICKYDDFEEFADEYKNPRNFASGSIRLLDSKICSKRKLTFVAWDLIESDIDFKTLNEKLEWLTKYFIAVPYFKDNIFDTKNIREYCKELSYPIDGLVYKFDNIEKYESLGNDNHHPHGGLAFKFYDEEYDTTLTDIIWSQGRTGALTPIAKFKPIDIDGTTVQKASLHNISILKKTLGKPYIGQKIKVFKANQIIPQIKSAEIDNNLSSYLEIPKTCPVCGQLTKIKKDHNTEILVCSNSSCGHRFKNHILHFINKNNFDIEALSDKTVEKLINLGWIKSEEDIFKLKDHYDEWITLDGFKEKSVNKILTNIENSKTIELYRVISAIGISNVEKQTAKEITKTFKSFDEFISAVESKFDFSSLNNIGQVTSNDILQFDYTNITKVLPYLNIIVTEKETASQKLSGMSFCITGKLSKKRDDIVEIIEKNGGKIASVSKNLTYLINNDKNSTSSKNKKAKELNIQIISEQEFEKLLED